MLQMAALKISRISEETMYNVSWSYYVEDAGKWRCCSFSSLHQLKFPGLFFKICKIIFVGFWISGIAIS